ncbi:MAG: hypothetical protein IAG13_26350, partial [Deltaproteobacteria bacterium]|nr:hypothetical protein [Nannocystaceae bacterium]
MSPAPRRWLALALVAIASCQQQNTVVVPNRVLDRPLDISLACVRRTGGDGLEVLSPDQCDGVRQSDCEEDGVSQLIGFVANSAKNEVGMFRRCDVNGMVDLDPEAPGYNMVPVGKLPSRIVQTPDCRVVTANAGSCDLSAIEMPALAAYAVGLQLPVAPSGLIATIIPRRSDGTPLGAAPGDMIAVPRGLSLAGSGDDPIDTGDDGGAGETTGAGESTGAGETTGGGDTDDDVEVGTVCNPDISASVYITFPRCQLVAEVNLQTQRILQSRQFVLDDDGVVTMVDSGPDPVCPIECPDQFDGDLPEDAPSAVDGGVSPRALALVQPEPETDEEIRRDELEAVTESSLFVGGNGSDEIFEIPLLRDANTNAGLGFAPPGELRRLELESPAGIEVIRPTPPMFIPDQGTEPEENSGVVHQFLYVIAGDGSTHVVDRDFAGASL